MKAGNKGVETYRSNWNGYTIGLRIKASSNLHEFAYEGKVHAQSMFKGDYLPGVYAGMSGWYLYTKGTEKGGR